MSNMLQDDPNFALFWAGGKLYKLAPMTFSTLKIAWPVIARLGKIHEPNISPAAFTSEAAMASEMQNNPAMDPEMVMIRFQQRLDLMMSVIFACIKRGNPELRQEDIEGVMSLAETQQIPVTWHKLCVISGLIADGPSGEAKPSDVAEGQTSTAILSPSSQGSLSTESAAVTG